MTDLKDIPLGRRMEAASKLQVLEIPWAYNKRLGFNVSMVGSQVSFADNGDFISLDDARDVIRYYAEQFGLEVKDGTTKTSKK